MSGYVPTYSHIDILFCILTVTRICNYTVSGSTRKKYKISMYFWCKIVRVFVYVNQEP